MADSAIPKFCGLPALEKINELICQCNIQGLIVDTRTIISKNIAKQSWKFCLNKNLRIISQIQLKTNDLTKNSLPIYDIDPLLS